MEAITKLSSVLRRNPIFTNNTSKLQDQIRERENKLLSFKSCIEMSYDEFKELICAYAYEIMLQRSVIRDFVVDQNDGPIIKQLYLYLTNNPACDWNLNAGLMFAGKVGCGKSLLMMAYLKISNEYTGKLTTSVHAKTLAGLLKTSGFEEYSRRPLFIDELGREESEVKDYGNVVKPIIDLFALRYEYGARTYATTNFKLDTIEERYGEFIRTRMEEMMTYVMFPGESRRLKNEVKTK
jgi:hypothetical protein